jgi:uroporphyrinogen III methyltransferase/synthase
VPGYEDVTKKDNFIDWTRLATGVGTIVFLMTVKNIAEVCKKLIENGRRADTPVAVIRWGTRADQTSLVSDLANISRMVKEKDIKPPAVMVVGDVVKLRDTLKWIEKKPLFGQRILVTREHSYGFEPLEDMGAEVIEFSTIKIVRPDDWSALDKAIDKIGSYDWITLTSGNGVKFFFQRLFEKGVDIRDLKGIRFCAVGSKTASAIRKFGIKVDLIPEEFNAEGLINAFVQSTDGIQQTTDKKLSGIKILLPRAEVAREVFPNKVRDLGGEIDVPAVYKTTKPEVHGKRLQRFLKEGKISIATFTSAATFNNFLDITGDNASTLLKDVAIAVIGPVTAKAVEKAGLKVTIMPKEATIDAMVREIINWVAKKRA